MKNKIYYLCMCLLFISLSCSKEDLASISGKVTDFETGKPISNVNVALYYSGSLIGSTTTDKKGVYHLKDIELSYSADYNIVFSHEKYNTFQKHLRLKPGQKIPELNVTLQY